MFIEHRSFAKHLTKLDGMELVLPRVASKPGIRKHRNKCKIIARICAKKNTTQGMALKNNEGRARDGISSG